MASAGTNSKDNTLTLVLTGPSQVGKSTFVNDMVGKPVAPVGDGENGVSVNVALYEASSLTKDFLIFDTPGFFDNRGLVSLTDDRIKDMIEKAILQNSNRT
jgi:GTPase Era involved in 16S rRNA processing